MKKATEDQFNELHNLVTKEFLKRVKSGEASAHELKAACDWLKTNDVTGIAYDGSPLDKLANVMPKVDPDLVKRSMYGKISV
tara:strand:+ start:319 stop:564 length:246 start_codon:yes stop_codon:yes gene_type:complete